MKKLSNTKADLKKNRCLQKVAINTAQDLIIPLLSNNW